MRLRKASLALVLVATVLATSACGAKPERPQALDSLLLVTIDTLRADHVSAYNPKAVATPQFDALAARGALIERAWTAVPLTTPAHASIMTGCYPPTHGVRNNARFRLPDEVTTLAEVMKRSGRATAAVVASFTTSRAFGLDQGFESFDDDFGNDAGGAERAQRSGDEVVDHALAWLGTHRSTPFFLWVHLYDPHTPYTPPAEYARLAPGDPYSGEVAFADAQLGRLLDALKRDRLDSHTVIAVVADHGEGLGTHGEEEHGFLLYEESLHVPMTIVAPGKIAAGTKLAAPVGTVDLMPTLLSLLAVTPPTGMSGVDLLAPGYHPRPVYAETLYPFEEFGWSALYAWRDGEEKLIAAPTPELYELDKDPKEGSDIAANSAPRVEQLHKALATAANSYADPARLAAAAGFGGGDDPEAIARLESLGYVASGAGSGSAATVALAAVGGRNPHEAMEELRLFKRAQDGLRSHDFDHAIRLLEKVDSVDRDNPQILLKLAEAYEGSGKIADAEQAYKRLISKHPSFYLGTRLYSTFLEAHDRPKESRDLWVRLAGILPGYVGIETRTAQAELKAGMKAEAEQRLAAYLAKHPADDEAWELSGRVQLALEQPKAALAAFIKALDIKATNKPALEKALSILLSAKQPEDARRLVESLLRRAPNDPVLLQAQKQLP